MRIFNHEKNIYYYNSVSPILCIILFAFKFSVPYCYYENRLGFSEKNRIIKVY